MRLEGVAGVRIFCYIYTHNKGSRPLGWSRGRDGMTVEWMQRFDISSWDRGLAEGFKNALVFAGAFGVSLILTPLSRTLVRKLGMVDQPSERRINKTPIPRGGGLSVFIAFHLALAVFALLDGPISAAFSASWQWSFLTGSLMLTALGFVDDKFGVKPLFKLAGQVAVASFLFFAGIRINGILVAFPGWLDYAATVFWIVGAVNAFNLIDGMDGLATGLTFIASIGLAGSLLFTGSLDNIIPYAALAGACLGFLRYNFHPATVFLGDTGSMFLGLCVATLPLVSGSRLELLPALGVPLLAMGIPIFDTLLAIWRRTIRAHLLVPTGMAATGRERVRVMQPDKEHLHHRLLRHTPDQRTAAWVFYGISAALVVVGLLGMLLKKRAPGIFLIAFIVAVSVIVKHLAQVELWDTGRLLSNRRITIRKGLVTPLYILLDLLTLVLMWLLAQWVLHEAIPKGQFIRHMPLQVMSVLLFLVLTRTYRRVWRRAQFSDFSLLLVSVLFGVATGAGLFTIVYGEGEDGLRFSLVYAAFCLLPLMGLRLAVESLQGIMQTLKRHVLLQNEKVTRLLIYGAGIRFRNYMREQIPRLAVADSVIIGIIDDDLLFSGRVIYGYDVLGGLDDIPAICNKHKVNRIVITCVLPPERQAALLRMAREHGFDVSLWVNEERKVEK